MMNADRAPYFETCPRCGDGGVQRFATHCYCVGCNYSDVYDQVDDLPIPQWAFAALKVADKKKNEKLLTSVPPAEKNSKTKSMPPRYADPEEEAS